MTCDVGSNYQIEIGQLAILFSNLFNQKIIFTKKKIDSKKVDKYLPKLNKIHTKLKLRTTYNLKKSILLTIKDIKKN